MFEVEKKMKTTLFNETNRTRRASDNTWKNNEQMKLIAVFSGDNLGKWKMRDFNGGGGGGEGGGCGIKRSIEGRTSF
jgi:hypothetical protein